MIQLTIADRAEIAWAQQQVIDRHYLRKPVDTRCSIFAYIVQLDEEPIGCLIFGRPESTRCYGGEFTYGSPEDVRNGRAMLSRWQIINIARVWLDPAVQAGGALYSAAYLPGFVDRRGVWRSTLASTIISRAVETIGLDYLLARPPVWTDEPYQISHVISYCDRRRHTGTIYRAAGFRQVRANKDGIATFVHSTPPLSWADDQRIREAAEHSTRSQRYRAERQIAQLRMGF